MVEFIGYYERTKQMVNKLTYRILLIGCLFAGMESCGSQGTNNVKEDSTNNAQTFDYSNEMLDNWLKLGTVQSEVLERIGKPDKKGKDTYWGALGTFVQRWEYTSLGVILEMESEEEGGDKTVLLITISAPCTMLNAKNIGIGTSKSEVIASYEESIDSGFSQGNQLVVGSIYGGVIFSFESNKVSSIFIGAAAE